MADFLYALALHSDIITAPAKVLYEWRSGGLALPGSDYAYDASSLASIPYQTLDLSAGWRSFDIFHDLTNKGLERFAADRNQLLDFDKGT